mgnify:CR=1 FL=1|jgi:hypothetical protein|tara:strand:+ start:557 stop:805 length:249 start_codon:yes stop_codon:yes gene_type:complete
MDIIVTIKAPFRTGLHIATVVLDDYIGDWRSQARDFITADGGGEETTIVINDDLTGGQAEDIAEEIVYEAELDGYEAFYDFY